MKKILLIGGGGHCHSVLDSIISTGLYDEIGVVAHDDDNYQDLKNDNIVSEYLVGIDADLPVLFSKGWSDAFVTLGSVGNTIGRNRIYNSLKEIGFNIPVIVDRTAIVSKGAIVEEGTFVGKNAVINIGCKVGKCTIINSAAVIEHDCLIGAFTHVSPGAVLCGQVTVGNDSHVGAGSTVKQLINIGDNALIGMGSVVVSDIPSNVKAYGNPCKVVE